MPAEARKISEHGPPDSYVGFRDLGFRPGSLGTIYHWLRSNHHASSLALKIDINQVAPCSIHVGAEYSLQFQHIYIYIYISICLHISMFISMPKSLRGSVFGKLRP